MERLLAFLFWSFLVSEAVHATNTVNDQSLSETTEDALIASEAQGYRRQQKFDVEVAVDCTLTSEDIDGYLDDATRTWTLDDAAIDVLGNNVQAIVDCTQERDTILFDVTTPIQLSDRVILPWQLTLSAFTDEALIEGVFSETTNKTRFRCPSESDGAFLVSSRGALLANIAFEQCTLRGGDGDGGVAIVEVEPCDEAATGSLQMHHIRFSNNQLNAAQMLLLNTPSCTAVEMVDVLFESNVCNEGFCGAQLSTSNNLTQVVVRRNDFSKANKDRPPAVLYNPLEASTVITNMTAEENEATVLHAENGQLQMTDCACIENSIKANDDEGASSACLHLINMTATIHRCRFQGNRARSGAALWALASNLSINAAGFFTNAAVEGAGIHLNDTRADITDCTFEDNAAVSQGGGIQSINAFLVIRNTTFENNTATRGAGLNVEGNQLDVEESTFKGNMASAAGGGMHVIGEACRLESIILIGNKATDAGGGAVVMHTALAMISDLTCEGNTANLGGCLHIQGSPLLLENAEIRGNNATVNGGGLSIRNTTVANVSSVVFERNAVTEDGGALYALGNDITRITDTQFLNNSARRDGAGIYVEGVREIVLTNSSFEENTSGEHGGGLYCIKRTSLSIRRCLFLNNRSNYDGAGIVVARDCSGNFTTTTWLRNNAGPRTGGGVLIDEGRAIIHEGLFEENVGLYGSGINVETGTVDITHSRFHNNTSTKYGALSCDGSNATVTNSVFSFNQGEFGAAMGVTVSPNITVMGVTMMGNVVTAFGGCLMNIRSNTTFSDAVFESNTAAAGGGCLLVNEGELSLNNVRFNNCRSNTEGGAVWTVSSAVRISNVQFTNSTAVRLGGCMRTTGGRLSMSNVSFEKCFVRQSGGGLYLGLGVLASIENSSFVQNTAGENGGGIYVTQNVKLNGTDLKLAENGAEVIGGGICGEQASDIALRRSRFVSNRARSGGGSGFMVGTVVTIQESTFVNNTALMSGGDSYTSEDTTLTLIDCTAQGSRAASGGSILVSNSSLFITDTEFQNETAIEKGGAVVAMNGSAMSVDSVLMNGNAAQMGGALHLETTRFVGQSLRISRNAAHDGGGVMAAMSSTMLCRECLFEENTAEEIGGGASLIANDTQSLAFQFDNCIFARNAAAFGGGLDFVTPSSRSNCTDLEGNCTYLALSGTVFRDNSASSSGGALLASNLDTIRIECTNTRTDTDLSFLSLDELEKLDVLNTLDAVCPQWTRNEAEGFGPILASYASAIQVTILFAETKQSETVIEDSFLIPNHESGKPLPTIILKAVDALGQGPVKGRGDRSIVATMSSDDLFTGVLTVDMQNGTGEFPGIAGYASPGPSEVRIDYNEPSIPPFIITVQIRACKIGEVPVQNDTLCQRCPGGTYNVRPEQSNHKCLPCPEYGDCNDDIPRPKAGYWHSTPCSSDVMKCLTHNACNAPDRVARLTTMTASVTDCTFSQEFLTNYSAAQCREGYEGVLCGSCSDTHGRVRSFGCEHCLSKVSSCILVILSMFLLVGISALTIRGGLPSQRLPPPPRRQSRRWRESEDGPPVNVEMVRMHITGHVPREIIEGRAPLPIVDREAKERMRDLTKWRAAEITINFLQVTAVAIAVNVDWTDAVVGMFEIADFLGVATSGAATRSADCLISADAAIPRSAMRSILIVLNPIFVSAIFVVIWTLRTVRSNSTAGYLIKRCALSLLAVSYLSYISITKTSVNSLYCVDVHDATEAETDSTSRYWAVDTRLRCHEDAHAILEGTIGWPLLAVFSLGFPLAMATTLVLHRQRHGMQNAWLFESVGFLYRAYRTDYVYWESIIMLRKAALAVVVVFSYPLGANLQGVLCVCVLIVALYIHTACSPFRREFSALNQLEELSLFVSSLTFASGLFFNDEATSEPVRVFLTVLVILVNVGLFVSLSVISILCGIEYLRLSLDIDGMTRDSITTNLQVMKTFVMHRFGRLCGCRTAEANNGETNCQTGYGVSESYISVI